MVNISTESTQQKLTLAEKVDAAQSMLEHAGASSAATRLRVAVQYAQKLGIEALYAWVDVPRALAEVHTWKSRLAQTLSSVRNIAALVPLIFTWKVLADAANEYQTLVTQNPPLAYQSFLILWQDRFGGQAQLSFSGAAIVDVILLLIVFGLTVSSILLKASAKSEVSKIGKALNEVVEHIAYTILLEPLSQVGNEPERWAEAVRIVIRDAMVETKELSERFASSNQQALRSMMEHLDAMKSSTEQLHEGLLSRVDAMSVRVVSQVSAALESVQSGNDELRKAAQSELENMSAATSSLSRTLAEETRTITEHMTSHISAALQESTKANQETSAKATRELEQIRSVTEQMVTSAGQATEHAIGVVSSSIEDLIKAKLAPLILEFKVHVEKLQQAEVRYHESAASLAYAVSQLETSAAMLAAHTGTYSSTANDIKAVLQVLAESQGTYVSELRASQAQYVPPLTDAVKGMRDAASSISTIAGTFDPAFMAAVNNAELKLEHIGRSLDTASSRLQIVTDELEHRLQPMIAGLSQVEQNLSTTSYELTRAATRLGSSASEGRSRRRFWLFG